MSIFNQQKKVKQSTCALFTYRHLLNITQIYLKKKKEKKGPKIIE